MQEIWKDVKDYEGYYQVSNLGNVKSVERVISKIDFIRNSKHIKKEVKNVEMVVKERQISKCTRNGYNVVYFSKNNKCKSFQIHRLVALHFIDNPLKKEMVNHLDGNKKNNNVKNLEWVTVKENNQHAFNTGLMDSVKVKVIRSDGIKFSSMAEAARSLNVTTNCVRDVLIGRQKTTKGYTFKYEK